MKTPPSSAISPEYPLLGLLIQHPGHGYELHQRLSEDLGEIWHIRQSQVYNILNRLEAAGLIAATRQEQEGLPARRLFHVTPKGRRHFDDWLQAPTGSSVHAIRLEFLTRLHFASTFKEHLAKELIDTQSRAVQTSLLGLQERLTGLPANHVINRLGLELRIRQLGSVLEWLEECRTLIGQHT